MSIREQFLNATERQIHIIKHLFEKVPDDGLMYRPQANMRNTLELMRYLSICASSALAALLGDPENSQEVYRSYSAKGKEVLPENFNQAMDTQMEDIRALMEGLSDKDLKSRKVRVIWGEKVPLGEALFIGPLAYLSAYRMQFFLYNKMSGTSEINTLNCWLGADKMAG